MISQEGFLKKYNIKDSDFVLTGLVWSDLQAIYRDHEAKQRDLVAAGNLVGEHLRQIRQVHSLKMRVKDPEHLIEKITRKKIDEPKRAITMENYEIEITDLVGVRALHLFKEDWVHIHEAIVGIWDDYQNPVANIRKGDPEDLFKQHGLEVREHPAGYRSVHYTVKSQPTKKVLVVEIQVRTIFEEGWSEIDHQLRYPYEIENLILCNYLAILNRFAGGADEMGSFIRWLKSELEKRESAYSAEIKAYESKNAEMIQNLESVKKKLNAESQERKKLQKTIDSLQSAKPPTLTSSSLPNYGFSGFPNSQKCDGCGQTYNSILGVCPNCMAGAFSVGMKKCKECGTTVGIGESFGSSDLCIRCGSRKLVVGFQNNMTCRRCGSNFSVGIGVIMTDPLCDICKATSA
jgi:ppGpp synthetase/RelA/SpoT-type nucleotidyltranferase